VLMLWQADGSSPHQEDVRTFGSVTAEGGHAELPIPSTTASTTTTTAQSTTTSVPPTPVTMTTRAPVVATTTRPAAPTVTPPGFESSITPIDAATAARMTASWRPGCPVALGDLRLVTITHWAFDGQPRPGELVVHAGQAENVRRAFAELFGARFPIEQVRLIDEFGGDDDRSMAANNTSAFNCRPVKGSTRWSQHAYGRAIDINPFQNPYVTGRGVSPPGGREFLRRDGDRQGLITARGPVVTAFARIGWGWGGAWSNPDYQHFSANGR
jgi:hypothetical protein